MMNKLKTLMLFRLLMLVIQKLNITQKLMKLKIKYLVIILTNILLHKNLIIFTADNFAARLARLNLATKNNIADFVKEADFDYTLKNIYEKIYFK